MTDGPARLLPQPLAHRLGEAVARLTGAGQGKDSDVLEAHRLLLAGVPDDLRGEIHGSVVHGPVVVEAGARVYRSLIVGPTFVARDAVVEDAVVGPHTSVGRGAWVLRSSVCGSLVDGDAVVMDLCAGVRDRVVGRGERVTGPGAPGFPVASD